MTLSRNKAMLVTCAMTLAGCAGTPAERAPASDTRAGADEVVRHCVRHTGTLLQVPEGQCVAHAGRVYTVDQLRSTGALSIQEGLRRLNTY